MADEGGGGGGWSFGWNAGRDMNNGVTDNSIEQVSRITTDALGGVLDLSGGILEPNKIALGAAALIIVFAMMVRVKNGRRV